MRSVDLFFYKTKYKRREITWLLIEAVTSLDLGRCIKLHAQTVVKKQRFLSNLWKEDLFIAEIVSRSVKDKTVNGIVLMLQGLIEPYFSF